MEPAIRYRGYPMQREIVLPSALWGSALSSLFLSLHRLSFFHSQVPREECLSGENVSGRKETLTAVGSFQHVSKNMWWSEFERSPQERRLCKQYYKESLKKPSQDCEYLVVLFSALPEVGWVSAKKCKQTHQIWEGFFSDSLYQNVLFWKFDWLFFITLKCFEEQASYFLLLVLNVIEMHKTFFLNMPLTLEFRNAGMH